MVGVPIDNDAFVADSDVEMVRNGGAERLARIVPVIVDKHSANLIDTILMVQRTFCVERVIDPVLPLPACQRADTGTMWMLERLLELPGAAN